MNSLVGTTIPFGSTWGPDLWQSTPLEDFMRPSSMTLPTAKQGLMNVDLVEGPSNFTLFCDVPGVMEEDIDMSYDNDFLTIRIKRNPVLAGTKIRSERDFGNHQRKLRLPVDCDKDSANACVCNGEKYTSSMIL